MRLAASAALALTLLNSAAAQLTVEVAPDQKIFAKHHQFVLIRVFNTSGQAITQVKLRATASGTGVDPTGLDALGGGDPLSTITNAPATQFFGRGTTYTVTDGGFQWQGILKTASGTQLSDGLIGVFEIDGSRIANNSIVITPATQGLTTQFVNGTMVINPTIVERTVTVLHCHTPFADADGDSDVDLDDFGTFQRCVTGHLLPADYTECGPFDRPQPGLPSGDGKIDAYDAAAFAACLRGANVPPDPACENP